jgi:hypothetical protein
VIQRATAAQKPVKPKKAIETFAGKLLAPEDYEEYPIRTEDFGAVLLRLGDRTRGAFTVSQMAAGRKNRLLVEIYGSRRAVAWHQESPNELWIGRRDGNNELVVKDPALLERRMRAREREADQRLVIRLGWVSYLLAFLLPGFDQRFGWSHVPLWLSLAALPVMIGGYLMFVLVMNQNRYASRVNGN